MPAVLPLLLNLVPVIGDPVPKKLMLEKSMSGYSVLVPLKIIEPDFVKEFACEPEIQTRLVGAVAPVVMMN
jgi:hypothetical protein